MYVTRPLSLYRKNPSSLSLPPPEGPNSGYLVIQGEESDITCCFGLCKDHRVYNLPIPQNKNLTIQHVNGTSGENRTVSNYYVMLFPVLNQPVSSGRYYAIKTSGRHKGEAYINSKEEDMGTCCFCNFIRDEKARLFDSRNIHHQFEISLHQTIFSKHGKFLAKSVAPNGFPPYFLRRKGWKLYASTPKNYELGEAAGLDSALRARLPEFNFPLSYQSSETVEVGKWYSPFIFIRDGMLRDQVKTSMYYEVTLEQRWEQIFACENNYGEDSNVVVVDVLVQREDVLVAGREIVHEREVVDGVVWFRSVRGEVSVGLSLAIVEQMKWEQERVGWFGGKDRQVRVKREDKFADMSQKWKKFGCYVLVERFVLKRNDGSLVLTHDFKHTHQIKAKWE